MNLQPLFVKETILKAVREFFYEQQFHEIITPTMNTSLPLEPNIYPFKTTWKTVTGERDYYLSTSPESGLKKMLAEGIGNCFAISKSFRNLEDASNRHTPEFLMLEWYREHATYVDIMKDVKTLLMFVKKKVDLLLNTSSPTLQYQDVTIDWEAKWPAHTMTELFEKYADVSLEEVMEDELMRKVAEQKGYTTARSSWEQLFNQIFLNEIEPQLGMNPCFVTDFPARISPLCLEKLDQPHFTERFEFYLAGMELANGNTENTDTKAIQAVFNKEHNTRVTKGLTSPPIDSHFLHSLETMSSLHCAGIGLGIDRLAMIFSNSQHISDVEPFSKQY